MAAKKEPTENIASVIETFEILIARKKKIQWIAISIPTKTNFATALIGNTNGFFVITKNSSRKIDANSMRYQTKEASRTEISSPSTAVNPQMNTIK